MPDENGHRTPEDSTLSIVIAGVIAIGTTIAILLLSGTISI